MNKTDLIQLVAEKTALSKKDSEKAVNAVLEGIMDAVAAGEKVQLIGFGTFEKRQRAAKMGRNPSTGEQIRIPATSVPAFKAGKSFKERIK
ncbi:MAG: HU family DNA-binding protein [Firmicutes bacterium]|nr:HU family DNA-binding protein [Bacillota bacterium]HOB35603.1 HU family DNA-binding protein [Bacillota bacterium]HPZ91313.1 HU family DNA-binding protein [Bacillota bacterium]HQE02427.1 HU family DNA-binding protein [Bacillota bacterium]